MMADYDVDRALRRSDGPSRLARERDMVLPQDRNERIQVYAKALGRSPADIEAQLCRLEQQRASQDSEHLSMPELVDRIAQRHGIASTELLRNALLLAEKIRLNTSE